MELITEIKKLSEEYFSEIKDIRRHIHKNPELSFREFKTSEFIISQLKKLDIPFKKGIAGTGIVAWINGSNNGRIVALRAEMDALPINEENNVSYCSVNNNCMHACGHDVHTACLIGAAKILKELKDSISGKIFLIFQPAEERLPGGALEMINSGIFDKEKPDFVIAQHVEPDLDTGIVGFKAGIYMAAADEIYLKIIGQGGHAALPHKRTNNLLAASKIIVNLHEFIENHKNKHPDTILVFGKMIANGATNIIPAEVLINGTLRTMDEDWRHFVFDQIIKIAKKTAVETGAKCEVEIKKGYPVLINNKETTRESAILAGKFLGKKNVTDLGIRMTGEDFAYFSQKFPSVFYRLGTAIKKPGITAGLHSPNFDIDENALKTGMGLLAFLAIKQKK